MAAAIRFYLDENVPVVIADQLRLRGIDAITARDLGLLSVPDAVHLTRATEMGRVLCTYDSDYVELATSGITHAGIVIGQRRKHDIGDWGKGLELIHGFYDAGEMQNHVEYL